MIRLAAKLLAVVTIGGLVWMGASSLCYPILGDIGTGALFLICLFACGSIGAAIVDKWVHE